jgi:hypothetical protein
LIFILIYLLTAIRLITAGSGTVHIYTQTIHRTNTIKNFGFEGFLGFESKVVKLKLTLN